MRRTLVRLVFASFLGLSQFSPPAAASSLPADGEAGDITRAGIPSTTEEAARSPEGTSIILSGDEAGSTISEHLWAAAEESDPPVSDPLEPVNRFFFTFNHMIYHGVMKPVATVYAALIPEGGRVAVRQFFHNLAMPARVVNALLQGKGAVAGRELERFGINTLLGAFGLFDVAEMHFNLDSSDEDLGQSLAHFGLGDQVYLVLPLIGPSNARDAVGFAGDTFMDPLTYLPESASARLGISGFNRTNATSLRIGEYEEVVESAIDPYISIRDAYLQLRQEQVRQ
ncbi:MAG: VacJ family lipoprotein [Magnetococcales bacterium]|nr:VacJ family lipoprotein [Magnetococcales bacterium]